MESDSVRSASVFPAFRPRSLAWWSFWLLISIQIAVILNIVAKFLPNSDLISRIIICVFALLTGWFLPSFGKKRWVFSVTILTNFLAVVLIQSHALTNILSSFTLLIFRKSELSHSTAYAFHITTALQMIWLFVIDIAKETPRFLDSMKLHATLFQFTWGILLWICFTVTSALIRRKIHALIASVPILLLIVFSTIFTNIKPLAVIITLTILLIACTLLELVNKEIIWKNSGIDYSPEIRFDSFTFSFPIIIITILFAGLIPEIDLDDIRRKWDEFTEKKEEVTQYYDPEAMNNEQIINSSGSDHPRGVMPRSHLLGSGPELSTREVMTFQTNMTTNSSESDPLKASLRYYLTGSVYDYYTGKGWLTSNIISSRIQPNEQINPIAHEGYQLIVQTIEKKDTAPDSLYLAGTFISVNVPVEAFFRSEHDFFSAVDDSRYYSGYSLIPLPSEIELRGYQEPVPVWILERYLQLPNTLTDRTRKLADAITYDKETSYDKALAIQSYLRSFPYSLDLPQIPDNTDVIDYFLFDLQKGYCDYFASAMVVMARTIGIPARLVVGYTSGNYDFDANYFVITEENAHAWPELYFSSSGWIAFEPTSSLPVFSISEVKNDSTDLLSENLIDLALPEIYETRSLIYLLILLGFIVSSILCWFLVKSRKTTHDHTLSKDQEKIKRSFKRLVESTKYLGINYQTSMTPLEFLESFQTNFSQKYPPAKSSDYQYTAIGLLVQFVDLFNLYLYAQGSLHKDLPNEMISLVRKLNRCLFFLKFSKIS